MLEVVPFQRLVDALEPLGKCPDCGAIFPACLGLRSAWEHACKWEESHGQVRASISEIVIADLQGRARDRRSGLSDFALRRVLDTLGFHVAAGGTLPSFGTSAGALVGAPAQDAGQACVLSSNSSPSNAGAGAARDSSSGSEARNSGPAARSGGRDREAQRPQGSCDGDGRRRSRSRERSDRDGREHSPHREKRPAGSRSRSPRAAPRRAALSRSRSRSRRRDRRRSRSRSASRNGRHRRDARDSARDLARDRGRRRR